jgi:hypothetical protein
MSVSEVKSHEGTKLEGVTSDATIVTAVKELINRLVKEDGEALDGGSANMFPAVLDAANRWNEDVTAYLATSTLSESDQKLFRGCYYDEMMSNTFGDLRQDFINHAEGFSDTAE